MKSALLAIAAFAAGVGAGWLLHRPPAVPAPEPAPPPRSVTRVVEVPVSGTCEDQLLAAKALLAAQRVAAEGTPVPFPDDLPPPFTAARFEAEVRAALAACPDAPVKLAFVDCAEFPCQAWFETTASQADNELRDGCSAWKARFPNDWHGMSSGSLMVEGQGTRPYLMVAETPEGWHSDDPDNAGKRFEARLEDGKQRLMDLWGAREQTERESLESSIRFFEALADPNPSSDAMLQHLREELEALPKD